MTDSLPGLPPQRWNLEHSITKHETRALWPSASRDGATEARRPLLTPTRDVLALGSQGQRVSQPRDGGQLFARGGVHLLHDVVVLRGVHALHGAEH